MADGVPSACCPGGLGAASGGPLLERGSFLGLFWGLGARKTWRVVRWASDAYPFQCLPFQGPSDIVGGGRLVIRLGRILCVCVCVCVYDGVYFNHCICGM